MAGVSASQKEKKLRKRNLGEIFLYLLFALVCLLALALLLAGLLRGPSDGQDPLPTGEAAGTGSGGATGSQLPPCSLTANFSALPLSSGCCPGGALRLVFLGSGQTPFLAGPEPVSYTAVCSSLCENLVPAPGGTGMICVTSAVGGQETYSACLQALSPVNRCQGLAQPVATAGTAFLYAQRAASAQEAEICAGKCPLGW